MLQVVPSENRQRNSLEQEIALALIMNFLGQSATEISNKFDRRFPHGAGRLDRDLLEDEASAQHSVLFVFPDISGIQGRRTELVAWSATNYCHQNERCIVPRSSNARLRRIRPGFLGNNDMAASGW